MTPHLDLAELQRRPFRYWNIDGLPELFMGLLLAVWGAAWLIGRNLPHTWVWKAYWLTVPILLSFSGFAGQWAVRRLKRRITWPRAGFAEPLAAYPHSWTAALSVAALALALLLVLIFTGVAGDLERLLSTLLPLFFTAIFTVLGTRQRAPSLLLLGAFTFLSGITINRLIPGYPGLNWFFLLNGLVAFFTGAVRLVLFLKRHPAGAAE